MKARKYAVIGVLASASLMLAACGGGGKAESTDQSATGGASDSEEKLSVVNVTNAPLGDQSFFDDADRGMKTLASEGYKAETIQSEANNPAQWKTNLETASGADWGLIIVGSTQMVDILDEVAPKYPDNKYLIYDAEVDQPNVASITYKQNEGAFLAGVLAAEAIENPSDFPKLDGAKKVGIVGGMDIPVINDFAVGFKKGVESVNPDIEVMVSYIGDFADANRGYDQAMAMYNNGAGVVFQVAASAGLGVLKAAEAADKYAIGVDANQNDIHPGHILASMLKNIGDSLVSAVHDDAEGNLAFGAVTEYGLANKGVGLTFENNDDIVPDAIQKIVEEYAQKVVDGEIEVPTAF